MLRNGFLGLAANLPTDLKGLPTLQGMVGGMTPPTDNPTPAPTPNFNFGNVGESIDSKKAAQYLQRKGLIGADQIKESNPNINDPNSIRSDQADWKISAIQHIMANAKKLGIRTPEALDANMNVLTNTLDPRYRAALKDPSFTVTHPNFPQVLKSILKDQWENYDNQNSIAKK